MELQVLLGSGAEGTVQKQMKTAYWGHAYEFLLEKQLANLENTNVWGSRVAPVAQETMAEHGSDVLNFITDRCGRLPEPPENTAWRDMATFYLRHAVSQWADEAYHIL